MLLANAEKTPDCTSFPTLAAGGLGPLAVGVSSDRAAERCNTIDDPDKAAACGLQTVRNRLAELLRAAGGGTLAHLGEAENRRIESVDGGCAEPFMKSPVA